MYDWRKLEEALGEDWQQYESIINSLAELETRGLSVKFVKSKKDTPKNSFDAAPTLVLNNYSGQLEDLIRGTPLTYLPSGEIGYLCMGDARLQIKLNQPVYVEQGLPVFI